MNSNELQAYEADMGKGINFTPWRQAVLEPRLAKKRADKLRLTHERLRLCFPLTRNKFVKWFFFSCGDKFNDANPFKVDLELALGTKLF